MPGGVCAVLDYETDLMAEYVAEMATRLFVPTSTVAPGFKKFVNNILTSTRLPSTTILLGMNYLAKRVNMLRGIDSLKTSENHVWKMLTVSLLLGSKFLDDNTFQNKSWSDVSSISVSELNAMEHEWLRHIDWTLYVNLDRSKDYNAWLDSWKTWQEIKRQQLQQQQAHAALREKLAPIVTNIRSDTYRQHSQHPMAYECWTPEENVKPSYRIATSNMLVPPGKPSAYRTHEASWPAQYQSVWPPVQAPVTPPDSGYGTPEYLNSAASVNSRYNDWFDHGIANGSTYNPVYQSSMNSNHASRGPSALLHQYFSNYGHSGWGPGPAGCKCYECSPSVRNASGHYFHQSSYGQPVMG